MMGLFNRAASIRVFGVASNSWFGMASISEFGAPSNKEVSVASNNGLVSDSKYMVSSDNGVQLVIDNKLEPKLGNALGVAGNFDYGDTTYKNFGVNTATNNHKASDKGFGDEFDIDNLVNERLDHFPEEENVFQNQTLKYLSRDHTKLSTDHNGIVQDTSVHPQNIELKGNTVYLNNQLSIESRQQTPRNEIAGISKNEFKTNRRGQKRMCLEQIKDEVKKRNILRCREYRIKKNESTSAEESELKLLERENRKLIEHEEALRERVNKLKEIYFRLIQEGHIRFC